MGAEPEVVRHHGLLGTVVELRVVAADVTAVDDAVVGEVVRLSAVLNARDERSELRRWARGEVAAPSADLTTVLDLADGWTRRSGGAFDPAVGDLVELWDRAAADDRVPTDEELRAAVAGAARARSGSSAVIDLSAIAKGWIVDRAAAAGAAVDGVESLTVNAGGDLRHVGAGTIVVGIEDPRRPYDNEPPLTAVRIGGAAVATSGGARRGWRISGRWYPHVLDPRTGRPVDRVASASVIAPDAVTADVVATVATVAGIAEVLALVERLPDVECLVVDRAGDATRSPGWAAHEVGAGGVRAAW